MRHKLIIFILLGIILLSSSLPALAKGDFYKLDQQTWEYNLGDSPKQEDWQLLPAGQNIPNTKNYKYIWLRVQLPDIKLNHPVIYTNRGFQVLMPYEFYLNGNRFFKNGPLQGKTQLADHIYSLVPLPENWQGKYLYIRIYNNYHPILQDRGLINSIGSYKKTVKNIFTKNFLPLILSLAYLIIGFLALQLFFFRYRHPLIFFTGAVVLSVFIYAITHNPIISFLFSKITNYLLTLYYFNVFILGGLLNLYLSKILTYRSQLFVKLGISYFSAGVVALTAYLINPYTKIIGAKIYNITLIGVIVIIIYSLIKTYLSAKKQEKEKIKILSLGFLTATIGSLLAVIQAMIYQFDSLSYLKPIFSQLPFTIEDYTSLGLFFFILSLVHVTGKHLVQINQLASQDGLTKLYNHNHFKQELMQKIEKAKSQEINLSLLMIDIDNFKELNDSYGHQAGDKVLKKLAQNLKNHCRAKDTVARYGGEEFAIILPEVAKEKATDIAQRLIKTIRELTVHFDDNQLKITVSIGLASYQSGQSRQDLIAQADHALYQAKRNGKDQIQI